MEGYVTKLMEQEKLAEGETREREAMKVDLQATQDKVASLHSEVKEKTACNDILRRQHAAMKEVNDRVT